MTRKLLTAVAGICGAELVVWTWFRLRRPKPLPFRPDWLDAEVAKLHSSSCEEPSTCTPESPTCGMCVRARAEFMRQPARVGPLAWLALTDVQRESWRQEVTPMFVAPKLDV